MHITKIMIKFEPIETKQKYACTLFVVSAATCVSHSVMFIEIRLNCMNPFNFFFFLRCVNQNELVAHVSTNLTIQMYPMGMLCDAMPWYDGFWCASVSVR